MYLLEQNPGDFPTSTGQRTMRYCKGIQENKATMSPPEQYNSTPVTNLASNIKPNEEATVNLGKEEKDIKIKIFSFGFGEVEICRVER